MSLNMMSLKKKLSFSSLYFVSSEYNLVKLINSRSYSVDLIDWFTDESDETNDREINDRDEIDEEYSWDKKRDETSDEYSVDRL
jgi:hypothetical protein